MLALSVVEFEVIAVTEIVVQQQLPSGVGVRSPLSTASSTRSTAHQNAGFVGRRAIADERCSCSCLQPGKQPTVFAWIVFGSLHGWISFLVRRSLPPSSIETYFFGFRSLWLQSSACIVYEMLRPAAPPWLAPPPALSPLDPFSVFYSLSTRFAIHPNARACCECSYMRCACNNRSNKKTKTNGAFIKPLSCYSNPLDGYDERVQRDCPSSLHSCCFVKLLRSKLFLTYFCLF